MFWKKLFFSLIITSLLVSILYSLSYLSIIIGRYNLYLISIPFFLIYGLPSTRISFFKNLTLPGKIGVYLTIGISITILKSTLILLIISKMITFNRFKFVFTWYLIAFSFVLFVTFTHQKSILCFFNNLRNFTISDRKICNNKSCLIGIAFIFFILSYMVNFYLTNKFHIWIDRFSGPFLFINNYITSNYSFSIEPLNNSYYEGYMSYRINQVSIFPGLNLLVSAFCIIANLNYLKIVNLPFYSVFLYPLLITEFGFQMIQSSFNNIKLTNKNSYCFLISGIISLVGSPKNLLGINPNSGGSIYFANITYGFILLILFIIIHSKSINFFSLLCVYVLLITSLLSYKTTGLIALISFLILSGVYHYKIERSVKRIITIPITYFFNVLISLLYGLYIIFRKTILIPSSLDYLLIFTEFKFLILVLFLILAILVPIIVKYSFNITRKCVLKLLRWNYISIFLQALNILFFIFIVILISLEKNIPQIPYPHSVYGSLKYVRILRILEFYLISLSFLLIFLYLKRKERNFDLDHITNFLIFSIYYLFPLLILFFTFGGITFIFIRIPTYIFPLILGIAICNLINFQSIKGDKLKTITITLSILLIVLSNSVFILNFTTYSNNIKIEPLLFGSIDDAEYEQLTQIINEIDNKRVYSDMRIINALQSLSENVIYGFYSRSFQELESVWYSENINMTLEYLSMYKFLILSKNFMHFGIMSYDYIHSPLTDYQFYKFMDSPDYFNTFYENTTIIVLEVKIQS